MHADGRLQCGRVARPRPKHADIQQAFQKDKGLFGSLGGGRDRDGAAPLPGRYGRHPRSGRRVLARTGLAPVPSNRHKPYRRTSASENRTSRGAFCRREAVHPVDTRRDPARQEDQQHPLHHPGTARANAPRRRESTLPCSQSGSRFHPAWCLPRGPLPPGWLPPHPPCTAPAGRPRSPGPDRCAPCCLPLHPRRWAAAPDSLGLAAGGNDLVAIQISHVGSVGIGRKGAWPWRPLVHRAK